MYTYITPNRTYRFILSESKKNVMSTGNMINVKIENNIGLCITEFRLDIFDVDRLIRSLMEYDECLYNGSGSGTSYYIETDRSNVYNRYPIIFYIENENISCDVDFDLISVMSREELMSIDNTYYDVAGYMLRDNRIDIMEYNEEYDARRCIVRFNLSCEELEEFIGVFNDMIYQMIGISSMEKYCNGGDDYEA